MSLHLTIGNKEIQGKPSFAFLKLADSKYGTFQEQTGKMVNGLSNILSGIVEGNVQAALEYWDCATAHLKDKPSVEKIEAALEQRIEKDEDTEPLLKEIYNELTNSGFFKKTVKEFWQNVEMMKDFGKDKEEKAQNRTAYDLMMTKKKEIEA